jgi:hypothetical protein
MFASKFIVGISALLCVPAFSGSLFAGSLTVIVRDPGKVLVGDATVGVTGQAEGAQRTKSTDATGRATFDQLPSGAYRVSVNKQGFAPWEGPVTVRDRSIELPVALTLSPLSTSVRVSGRRSPLANSDPNYQALRTGKLTKVYRVSNLTMKRDTGTFTFRSGSFSFLAPVLGHVTTGVFVGDGSFAFKPAGDLAALRLKRMMGSDSVNEDFTALVVFFSDVTFDEIRQHSEIVDESPERHEAALKRVRNVIQDRREPRLPPSPPRSQLELMLNWEEIPNFDAEILAEIYNGDTGDRRGSFRAFLNGKKNPDLRFLLNPHGAMPMLKAPEEVALINFDPNSNSDGVWYLSHTLRELQADRPDSKEEKRLIAPDHYKIESVLGSPKIISTEPDLRVTCSLSFHALQDGVRMAKLDLMPDLQISRVTWNGTEIPFVQESRSHDGSFYLQMPEPLTTGRTYEATFEYAGGEIVQSRFGWVPPRRIWYPTPSGQGSRATYDLTFRIPQGSKIVTVGNQVAQSRDGFWDGSEWTSDVPITQAVFRWMRDASLTAEVEETTKSRISLYRDLKGWGFAPPSPNYMLGDIGNALRLFNTWFGKPAYDNFTFLVQTGGPMDSLPGLLYVRPLFMAGGNSVSAQIGFSLSSAMVARVDEGFPRLMAQQWWGNTVSPASFHDEWLSTGLAGFSASVYDLAAGNNDFKDRWQNDREAVLLPSRVGLLRANDAGPAWMGLLNDTQTMPIASNVLNVSKGAYIVQMLRAMMWDPQTLDRDFQAMMRDFVASFANRAVSSEDFQAVVEKHMKPSMDLAGDRRMDWFFDEWLYGTDVPSYRLEYSLQPVENGDALLEGKLTQTGVSPSFRMPVPIFVEHGGKNYRVGVLAMQGNSSNDFKASLSARPNKVLLNVNHDVLSEKDEVVVPKPAGR